VHPSPRLELKLAVMETQGIKVRRIPARVRTVLR
jgi:hypothetical protein